MATAPMSADTSRLSFAKVCRLNTLLFPSNTLVLSKTPLSGYRLIYLLVIQVAASAGKANVALGTFAKVVASTPVRDHRKDNVRTLGQKETSDNSNQTPMSLVDTQPTANESKQPESEKSDSHAIVQGKQPPESKGTEDKLVDAVKALNVSSAMPSLVVNGSGIVVAWSKHDASENFVEDPFQRTDSGSELGTKPPSLDGKSITSGTTFALDEKESLRPDDSASVKAAEDDDTFSGRGSIVAGSRIGSEAAARAYRAQFYEAPDRRNIQPMQERQGQDISTPQSGSSGQQTTDDGKPKPLIGSTGAPDGFSLFYRQTPDEKLLEALESPKDRIFLLRLEQDVISFVKDSK